MKYLILIFIFWIFSPLMLFAQFTITIKVENLRNNSGKVLLELSNVKEEVINGYAGTISNNKSTLVMNDLKPGKYAFKYFHDENNDNEINTNFMGIPKEGYGFSNNAKGTFGPPPFEKMVFELTKSDTIQCSPTYILKQK